VFNATPLVAHQLIPMHKLLLFLPSLAKELYLVPLISLITCTRLSLINLYM